MQTITEKEVNAGLTQASDAAFINAFTADGTPIKISKADLASVVAGKPIFCSMVRILCVYFKRKNRCMKKLSVFKRKLIRRYNNKSLWEFSKFKGYEGFFGYDSLKKMIQGETKIFQEAYGHNLRHWRWLWQE